jgi:hypothetical protein
MKNTKIGEVEFSTPAGPLSTCCCPQASTVHDAMLLKNAWMSSIRHVLESLGNRALWKPITTTRNAAARLTRTAISVTGGMVATAILINR